MATITGVVKWYNREKGYGFISCDNGNDVFVHHSQIKAQGPDKDLKEGESVNFDIQDSERGLLATNVHTI